MNKSFVDGVTQLENMKKAGLIFRSIAIFLILAPILSCSDKDVKPNGSPNPNNSSNAADKSGWSIPVNEVRDGGVGKDGIVAIESPQFTPTKDVDFLQDDDLVILLSFKGVLKVYPVKILDYHEIVNDKVNGELITISHCPLTGTSLAWAGLANNLETGYGVSGLLFNNNLIMYDRQTDSYWSQMMSQSVFGSKVCSYSNTIPVVETTWATYLKSGLQGEVMNTTVNGFNRNYDSYPYGNYKTDNDYILFPVSDPDDVIEAKQRVHLIIDTVDNKQFATVIPLKRTFFDQLNGFIVVGNEELNFAVSYVAKSESGLDLQFTVNFDDPSALLTDQEGTVWNFLGEAVSGPGKGQKLQSTQSMMSYWFPISSIFKAPTILNLHPTGG